MGERKGTGKTTVEEASRKGGEKVRSLFKEGERAEGGKKEERKR